MITTAQLFKISFLQATGYYVGYYLNVKLKSLMESNFMKNKNNLQHFLSTYPVNE